MAAKALFVICAQAVLIQMSLAQAIFPSLNFAGSGIGASGFGSSGISGLVGSGFASGSLAGSGFASRGLATSGTSSGFINIGDIVSSGPLLVTAISPIGPSGLAVASENIIEGILTVNGQLPYLSAVAFEGSLPTAGSGTATCGCGSGQVGIISEGLSNTGVRGPWF